MKYLRPWALGALLLLSTFPAVSDELQDIRQQIDALQQEYESRIRALEDRLSAAEAEAARAREQAAAAEAMADQAVVSVPPVEKTAQEKANTFNPAVSVILQGSLNSYSQDPEDYALPGFQLGGEAGLAAEGLTLDETELILSASIDQLFFGQTTIGLHDDGDGTEVEIEEADREIGRAHV